MPVWSCLPFPLGRWFQKSDFRNLREKLKRTSYFLTYLLDFDLKMRSGHLCKFYDSKNNQIHTNFTCSCRLQCCFKYERVNNIKLSIFRNIFLFIPQNYREQDNMINTGWININCVRTVFLIITVGLIIINIINLFKSPNSIETGIFLLIDQLGTVMQ